MEITSVEKARNQKLMQCLSKTFTTLKNARMNMMLLLFLLSVSGCETISRKCPIWLKPIPKSDMPFEETLPDELADFFYDYQHHYEVDCL